MLKRFFETKSFGLHISKAKRFGAAAGGGGRVGREAAVGGAGQIQRGGEGPGGEKRPQDHVNPRMEGQWGESEAISQPVDPSEVGG